MTSETQKVKFKVQALSTALSELESNLEPLFAQPLSETLAGLESIQQAKLQVAIPYAVYDLIFMYLKIQGVDPKTHPVISELERIKQYFEKIQHTENPPKRTTEIDKAAASRFIQHAISQAQLQKDQLQWKKGAAEADQGDVSSDSDSDSSLHNDESTKVAGKTSGGPSAGPSSLAVPTRVTSKMLERQRYEQKIKEDDEMNEDQDSDVLEVFEDDEGEDESPKDTHESESIKTAKKAKGKGRDTQPQPVLSATSERTTGKKRRRAPMDPFGDYGKDAEQEHTSSSSKKRKSPPSDSSVNPTETRVETSDTPKKPKSKKKKAPRRRNAT